MNRCIVGFAMAATLGLSSVAHSATSEGCGMGVWMGRFQPVMDQANQSGELFRIVGHCQSACTSFLGIRNVCVERTASLLVHAGHDHKRVISPYWTGRIMIGFKPKLREYRIKGRYMETLDFHTVSGSHMIDR